MAVVGFPLASWLIDGADLRPWIDSSAGFAIYLLAVVTVVAGWAASVWIVLLFRQRLAQAPEEALDERELGERDEAHVVAYRIVQIVVFALMLIAGFSANLTGPNYLTADAIWHVGASLAMLVVVMPSAVVVWRDRGDRACAGEPEMV